MEFSCGTHFIFYNHSVPRDVVWKTLLASN